MREFIKKFESVVDANNYGITYIPFITTVTPSSGSTVQNLACNQTDKKIVNNNGIVSIYINIPDNEIWYTSSNGQKVTPYSTSGWPKFTNTYENGKGIIKFTGDLTEIPDNSFKNVANLETVILPNGVTSIGTQAFFNCTGLTSLTIPNSVTTIGNYAITRTSLTSLMIPNSVTSIGNYALGECGYLTSIVIPNSVTSIGDMGFAWCMSLTSITCEATTPPTLGGSSVFGNTNNCPIYVPSQSVDAYKAAAIWSSVASRIQAI